MKNNTPYGRQTEKTPSGGGMSAKRDPRRNALPISRRYGQTCAPSACEKGWRKCQDKTADIGLSDDPWWPKPPDNPTIEQDEVHVWRALLDIETSHVHALLKTLTSDEVEKAQRFRFSRDRRRFIVARGVLRAILSKYLGLEPGRLRFCRNPYGKPFLAGEHGESELHFNLAHSDCMALYALALRRNVGVDLERVRSNFSHEPIAAGFFSKWESTILGALPKGKQSEAFFNCWTRKEAYVKAKGEGLSIPLDEFEVSFLPGEPAMLLRTYSNPMEALRWTLQGIDPGHGYTGALVVEGNAFQLRCWQWHPV